jgi:hypothetical protein
MWSQKGELVRCEETIGRQGGGIVTRWWVEGEGSGQSRWTASPTASLVFYIHTDTWLLPERDGRMLEVVGYLGGRTLASQQGASEIRVLL